MPDLASEASVAMSHCDEMHSLVTDLAVCAAQAEGHQGRGDSQAVEGVKQTARAVVNALEAHLIFFRDLLK